MEIDMPEKSTFAADMRTFNALFVAMGMLLLGVAGWIGMSVAHIPSIDQKIDDFIQRADSIFTDHESRIRNLESHNGR
jgi:hypothetical protein